MSKPSDFFRQALGRAVTVRLADSALLHGTLATLDGSLNLLLRNATAQGQAYSTLLVRGNHVCFLGVTQAIQR
jgi:small nuclear ribonucleoprotein (snRNP)-like protein